MSELQEITTTDLEKKISPDNESIKLSEKEENSDLDNDSFDMPGDENIAIVPPTKLKIPTNTPLDKVPTDSSIIDWFTSSQ